MLRIKALRLQSMTFVVISYFHYNAAHDRRGDSLPLCLGWLIDEVKVDKAPTHFDTACDICENACV